MEVFVTMDLSQYISPTVIFTTLGVFVLGLIAYGVYNRKGVFLENLADREVARGLITFLIAITTVGIAIILAVASITGALDDKRFDEGKQVLSILIGVLGTIVGFYFGSSTQQPTAGPSIVTTTLPDGAHNTLYSTTLHATGGTSPLKWSVAPALPAGLTLDPLSGIISGTPTAISPKSTYTFTVSDHSTPEVSSTKNFTLEIK
jgi:hypothetical protein